MQPFFSRRNRLQETLKDSDAFLIQQPDLAIRNSDVHHPFHPDRHFYYISGFDEPNAWLLITKKETFLWSAPENKSYELWNGPVLAQKAIDELAVDHWDSIQNIKNLSQKLVDIQNLFLIGKLPKGIEFSGHILEGKTLIDHMRIIKDSYEIEAISKSCHISAIAHNYLMAKTKSSKHETELMGHFIQAIMSQGANSLAYPPIVASGKNALILHYIQNNSLLSPKELILVDAGCEYQQYASDISRTFPASGEFSSAQQALYEACLDVQENVISQVKPGISLTELQETAVLGISQHLIDLKLINESLDTIIEEKLFLSYFPHRIGHTLGLDVHDISLVDDILKPGMVITIEPGIYVQTPGKFKNIGIRIEDDILVTKTSYKNLTQAAYKTPQDIQKVMNT